MVEVHGDPLRGAVYNLLDNAAKCDTTGGPLDVRVSAREITVADRGPSIPARERSRVFDRFHRADAARLLPGSRLGLAIVAEVLRANGGTVSISDCSGGGAEVSLRLRS